MVWYNGIRLVGSMTIAALISDKVRIGCSSARHLVCYPAVFPEDSLTRIFDFLSKYKNGDGSILKWLGIMFLNYQKYNLLRRRR